VQVWIILDRLIWGAKNIAWWVAPLRGAIRQGYSLSFILNISSINQSHYLMNMDKHQILCSKKNAIRQVRRWKEYFIHEWGWIHFRERILRLLFSFSKSSAQFKVQQNQGGQRTKVQMSLSMRPKKSHKEVKHSQLPKLDLTGIKGICPRQGRELVFSYISLVGIHLAIVSGSETLPRAREEGGAVSESNHSISRSGRSEWCSTQFQL